MNLNLRFKPLTFDLFEKACLGIGLNATYVLQGHESLDRAEFKTESDAIRFLRLVLSDVQLFKSKKLRIFEVASVVAFQFVALGQRTAVSAGQKVSEVSEKLGIALESEGNTTITAVLASMDFKEENEVRKMPLEDFLYQMGMKGVYHKHNEMSKL